MAARVTILRVRRLLQDLFDREPSAWVPTIATGWAVVLVPRPDEARAHQVLGKGGAG